MAPSVRLLAEYGQNYHPKNGLLGGSVAVCMDGGLGASRWAKSQNRHRDNRPHLKKAFSLSHDGQVEGAALQQFSI